MRAAGGNRRPSCCLEAAGPAASAGITKELATYSLPTRRQLLGTLCALALPVPRASAAAAAPASAPHTRNIPSSGEALPLVGLGTWITFNVGRDAVARDASAEVMRAFFEAGGRMIDSSPMYGSSQEVIGHGLAKLRAAQRVFSADKVWTGAASRGASQIEDSRRLWQVPRFDLLQVHNLLAWQQHLPMLFEMKAAGRVRYVGITTSEGRRHDEFERIMRAHPLDFVQLSYNAVDREAERRLLPLARERGMAVIVNRPFQQGALIDTVRKRPLPAWATEIDCVNWAQLLLKFVVSHPAVTCAIPATTSVAHVRENLGAARGRLPGEAMRRRISDLVGTF
ncbi:Aldo-keto reductase YhdN [Burkholderiaceae bacterium]|nr:Aldo-keto reductase YhdN [Burkholderiaceae bacterium]